ncbi:MAG: hypothetical protein VKN33_05245 [Candidatus Sericytochromatia bacterium]|nr:hypothetical protein [Candidatus Sericytochromatia bacterium]
MEPDLAVLMDDVEATLIVRDASAPLIPEKTDGYRFVIHRGRMAMDGPGIATLMNRHAYPLGTANPLKDLQVTLPTGFVKLDANFQAGPLLKLPIAMTLQPSVGANGRIALKTIELKAQGIPIDRVMSILGIELARLVPLGGKMEVEGDTIFINPVGMFPAPITEGRLKAVQVQGDHMVMEYDDASATHAPPLPSPDASAYIALVGHDLLVGKITMQDVCLQMIPQDPDAHWIEFALPFYRDQLAAGQSSLHFGDELLYRIPALDHSKN